MIFNQKNECPRPNAEDRMEQRFRDRVRQGTPEECWEWLGGKDRYGYGYIKHEGKMRKAHRVAWELTHGKIPEGLVVRHRCRGKCVNPAHLELGTFGDNARDRVRDRTSRGENNGFARLTEEHVRQIKLDLSQGGTAKDIARKFGVAYQTIYSIKSGRNWSWI